MKIKFLGTGSGKTSLDRFHSSILLSSGRYNLLVDTGDGISRAVISNGINFNSLNGILYSHLHPDHFCGLPSLIVQMKMINRNVPLDIFIHESLKVVVEDLLIHSYLLPERMGFEIHYKTFKDDVRFKVKDDFSFLARKNSHLVKLEKFNTKYPSLSLYSASFLFETNGKKIIYTSDIGSEKDLFLFKEFVPDILICEVTHLSPSVIFEKIIKINPGKVLLTHYSNDNIPLISEILANLPQNIMSKVKLASDGQSLEI